MKILYIAHLRENSGYGRSCRDYLESLKRTGHQISSLSVNFNQDNGFRDETENVSIKNPDLIINHTLPHFIEKRKVDQIAISLLETRNIHLTPWYQYLNICDQIWYPHPELNIFKKEKFIPQAVDLSIYNKSYPETTPVDTEGLYKFYFIGESIKRKNISGLLTSYLTEFSGNDPVLLVLKINHSTKTSNEIYQEVLNLGERIQSGLRKKNFPRYTIIPDFLPDDMIYGLHQSCDCFVSASHGESICYPVLDAIGFKNNVVINESFLSPILDKSSVCKSPGLEPCFAQFETFDFYNTCLEYWNSLDIINFGKKMRNAMSEIQNNKRVLYSFEDAARIINESII